VKIINDYLLHTSLSQGCSEVLKADVITLNKRMHTQSRRAVRIDNSTTSLLSNQSILGGNSRKKNVIAFFCNHAYHEEELAKLILANGRNLLTAIFNRNSAQQASARGVAGQPPLEVVQQQLRQSEGYYCPVCRQNENAKVEKRKTRRK
jgi:hypothetical protein